MALLYSVQLHQGLINNIGLFDGCKLQELFLSAKLACLKIFICAEICFGRP